MDSFLNFINVIVDLAFAVRLIASHLFLFLICKDLNEMTRAVANISKLFQDEERFGAMVRYANKICKCHRPSSITMIMFILHNMLDEGVDRIVSI